MKYAQVKHLPSPQFKRLVGVRHQTFRSMVWVMRTQTPPKLKSGRPSKLSLEDQVLVTLQYWREYRTYFHIGETWGVSEATICRIVHHVENTLIRSGRFRLPGKKWLLRGHEVPAIVIVDVTETPIERPKHRQKQFYSGKKKTHTLKSQIVVDQQSRAIICTAHGKGRQHDFRLWQVSGVQLHPSTQGLGDKGYQGWKKLHANSHVPKKKPKGGQLSKQEKRSNRELAQRRIVAEHVNRHLKIFRMLSERYRKRRRRFGLRWNLITALYNYELGQTGSLLQEREGLSSSNIFARGLLSISALIPAPSKCSTGLLAKYWGTKYNCRRLHPKPLRIMATVAVPTLTCWR